MYLLLLSRSNLRDIFPTVTMFVLCTQKLQILITTLFENYLRTASASGAPNLKVCQSARLYYSYYLYTITIAITAIAATDEAY